MRTLHEIVSESPLLPYIREAGYAVRKPWLYPERSLLDYLLIYVQDGCLLVRVRGEELTFRENEFCLLQPGDVHVLEGTTQTITPFVHMDLFYNPQRELGFPTRPGQIDLSAFRHLMQPRLNDLQGIHIPTRFVPSRPSAFKETMLRMIGLWLEGEGEPLRRLEAEHLAAELALSLLKDATPAPAGKSHKPQSLNWITSYFSFHLSDPITLEDMAKRARLSPSRFAAVFRQHFGMAPHQYLLHLRVQHAQELLRGSEYTLQEVASYCGFSDIHHFAKMFKKITGETPNQYRKANR